MQTLHYFRQLTTVTLNANHVTLQVYDTIASHFSGTRHSQWPRVREFIECQPAGSILADIGCGNGKYLTDAPNPSVYKVGIAGIVRIGHVFNDAFEYRGVIEPSKQIRFWLSVSGNSNSKLY